MGLGSNRSASKRTLYKFWGYQYTNAIHGGIDGDAIIFNHNAKDSEDEEDEETYATVSNEYFKFNFQC